jgi:GH15 family glucan-1,4-alpha-glucosidase
MSKATRFEPVATATAKFDLAVSVSEERGADGTPAGISGVIAVMRSLITLKALTYGPTGGIVAAPTASLPETLGGIRNWDYRFCWLRDATLSLLALMNAGYYEEAGAWRDWLLRAVARI